MKALAWVSSSRPAVNLPLLEFSDMWNMLVSHTSPFEISPAGFTLAWPSCRGRF